MKMEIDMILQNTDIVWTPVIKGNGVALGLHGDFVCRSLEIEPTEQQVQRLFNAAHDSIGKAVKGAPSNLFDFIEGKSLLKTIYLDAGGGVWLAAECPPKDTTSWNKERCLIYYGHNDDTRRQGSVLLELFQLWVNWRIFLDDS